MDLKEYARLIKLTAKNYHFKKIGDIKQSEIKMMLDDGIKICFLRHDIDFSPENALSMAETEAQHGIMSTYAVLLGGDMYNPFERKTKRCLKNILKLGHEVGLHFDPTLHDIKSENQLDRAIIKEKKALEDLVCREVKMFAFHNTTPFSLSCRKNEYGGCINAYSDFFHNEVEYTSDSNGYWRFRSWESLLAEKHKLIQILPHPIWWGHNSELPPYETVVAHCLKRFISEIENYTENFSSQNVRENRSSLSVFFDKVSDSNDTNLLKEYALHDPLLQCLQSPTTGKDQLSIIAKTFIEMIEKNN